MCSIPTNQFSVYCCENLIHLVGGCCAAPLLNFGASLKKKKKKEPYKQQRPASDIDARLQEEILASAAPRASVYIEMSGRSQAINSCENWQIALEMDTHFCADELTGGMTTARNIVPPATQRLITHGSVYFIHTREVCTIWKAVTALIGTPNIC